MKLLLEKFEVRALTILRALYSEERWWREKELSALIACAPDTTYKLLKHINGFFDDYFQGHTIITQPNKGIHLETKNHYPIGKIESTYIKNTLSFKMIDTIFHSRVSTLDDLADSLHISSSTAYRRLQLLKKYLVNHNLTLNISKLEITGSEIIVREFYYQLYWSVVKSDTWPFLIPNHQVFLKNCLALLSNTDFSLSSIEKLQFLYRLIISQMRLKNAHYLKNPLDTQLVDTYHEKYASDFVPFINFELSDWDLLLETRLLAFNLVSNPIFSDNSEDYLLKLNWHQRYQTLPFTFSHNLLKEMTELYANVDFLDPSKIIYKLIRSTSRALVFADLQMTHTDILAFNQQFAKDNILLFQHLNQSFEKNITPLLDAFPKMDQSYLFYNILLIFSRALDLHSVEKKIAIRLVCNVEPASEFYLEQQLKIHTQLNLDIDTSLAVANTNRHYDLLLTDFNICQSQQPTSSYQYTWDFPPCDRDWNAIQGLLKQIQEDNRQED